MPLKVPQIPYSAEARQPAAIGVLVLFFVMFNVGAAFLQARKIDPSHMQGAVIGYFLGVLLAALLMDRLEAALGKTGQTGERNRLWFLLALIFPGLFCLITPLFTGYSGTGFLNAFQPMLWSMYLPVALRLFFRWCPARTQALGLGAAMGVGYLCWAFLAPMVELTMPDGISDSAAIRGRILLLLNLSRAMAATGFAFIAWRLVRPTAQQTAKPEARTATPSKDSGLNVLPDDLPLDAAPLADVSLVNQPEAQATTQSASLLIQPAQPTLGMPWLFLLPMLVCFFLNGMLKYMLFARLLMHGPYPEYIQLMLAALMPLLGLYVARQGKNAVLRPAMAAVACFALAPVLLYLPVTSSWYLALYTLLAICHQTLLFTGTYTLGRVSGLARHPTLYVSAIYIAVEIAVPGYLLSARLDSDSLLGLSWGLGVLCICSLPLLRHATHRLQSITPNFDEKLSSNQPSTPEHGESYTVRRILPDNTDNTDNAGNSTLSSLPTKITPTGEPFLSSFPAQDSKSNAAEKLQAFATAFQLSERELLTLDGILNHLDMAAIGSQAGVSERTARLHLTNILRKTGCSNRLRLEHFFADWKANELAGIVEAN